MGVKERQAREREARKEVIRRAALVLFASRGFAATSMEQVAEAAELGKGTVYYYYPSKEALLEDVLDHYTSRFFKQLDSAIRDSDDLLVAIRKILLTYVEFHRENPHFFRLHHKWVTDSVGEARVELQRFRERYQQLRAPLDQKLANIVQRSFGGRVSSEVVLSLVGGLLLVYGHQLQRGVDAEQVRSRIEETLTLLERGLRVG